MVQSFRDLIVWQKSMHLCVEIYKLTADSPKAEEYRIVGQLTRAAASVAANIAEGHSRSSRKDFAHFVSIARGSLAETETFLLLGIELGFACPLKAHETIELVREISRMLTKLRDRLLTEGPVP